MEERQIAGCSSAQAVEEELEFSQSVLQGKGLGELVQLFFEPLPFLSLGLFPAGLVCVSRVPLLGSAAARVERAPLGIDRWQAAGEALRQQEVRDNDGGIPGQ